MSAVAPLTTIAADALAEVNDLSLGDRDQVLVMHSFLVEQLGPRQVEGVGSFVESLSPEADPAVIPAAVTVKLGGATVGAMAGAYLRNVDVGMVLYSAVRAQARGKGVYTSMRRRLIDRLASLARTERGQGSGPREMGYVVSELESGSKLHRAYVERWGAFEAACDYVQPPVQGLVERKLRLVFQPVAAQGPPGRRAIISVVREIYARVYRMSYPGYAPYLDSVVASMKVGAVREPPLWEGASEDG